MVGSSTKAAVAAVATVAMAPLLAGLAIQLSFPCRYVDLTVAPNVQGGAARFALRCDSAWVVPVRTSSYDVRYFTMATNVGCSLVDRHRSNTRVSGSEIWNEVEVGWSLQMTQVNGQLMVRRVERLGF